MIKKILEMYNKLDNITHKIMNTGLKFCFIISIISGIILCTYILELSSPIAYYIGLSLFRISLIFAIEFILCGFIADGIKKQMI